MKKFILGLTIGLCVGAAIVQYIKPTPISPDSYLLNEHDRLRRELELYHTAFGVIDWEHKKADSVETVLQHYLKTQSK